jgi:deoxyribodipyrimidine photo-lyase
VNALSEFHPTREAAYARLAAVNPQAYARTRNALDGAVTRLSPYLTHGLLSLREVYTEVHASHALDPKHKLVFELGWRAYWRHVWAHLGDGIHQSRHCGLLHEDAYVTDIPADVLEARTGVPAIDLAVRELYTTGYLHNHARMWLASYLVHLRKVHWHAGAQWMLAYLLDGDLASNHLSWQWVAGTGSSKPYLFNADNVARYAPAHWHSPGTLIDTSYEALDALARSTSMHRSAGDPRYRQAGVAQPAWQTTPPSPGWSSPENALAVGRDVWLVHPWSLGGLPAGENANVLVIGVGFAQCHAHMPWSALRWQFVTEGLQAHTTHLWWGDAAQVARALQEAHSVAWQPDPHVNTAMDGVQAHWSAHDVSPAMNPHIKPSLFAPVEKHCHSFSEWWRKTSVIA